jgi:magnesium transporter
MPGLWVAMLSAYGSAQDCLIEKPATATPMVLPDTVWLDLVEPTPEEEKAVEDALAIDIPTYQEDGATFMTATLIRRGDDERPEASPVTFIIKGNQLITVRYHHPQAFPVYVRQAMKPQQTAITGWGILISLLEAVVDRAADHLERVSAIVDETSRGVFDTSFVNRPAGVQRRRKKPKNLEDLLGKVGEEGDFNSKMRESLVSIGRMVAFMQAAIDQLKTTKETRENKARVKILQRDIQSLADHASFMSGKISFLLDAVLGMISIEQNGIIKIFTVASVVFLPPTLVASLYGMNFDFMPELHWGHGYLFAIVMMIISVLIPLLYFKRKGWL